MTRYEDTNLVLKPFNLLLGPLQGLSAGVLGNFFFKS